MYPLTLHSNVTGEQCHNIAYWLSDRKRDAEVETCTVFKHSSS